MKKNGMQMLEKGHDVVGYIFSLKENTNINWGEKNNNFSIFNYDKKKIQIQLKSTSWNFFDHFMKISASIFLNLSHPRGRLPQFGRRLNDWPDFYWKAKAEPTSTRISFFTFSNQTAPSRWQICAIRRPLIHLFTATSRNSSFSNSFDLHPQVTRWNHFLSRHFNSHILPIFFHIFPPFFSFFFP